MGAVQQLVMGTARDILGFCFKVRTAVIPASDTRLLDGGFANSQWGNYALVVAFRRRSIPNGNPMAKTCSMIASMSQGMVGTGSGGAALRGITIKFMTIKTPNPYRSEPAMGYRRKSGMRSTLRKKMPAMTKEMSKCKNTPSKVVAMPPSKAAMPNTPLAIYCNTTIYGVF